MNQYESSGVLLPHSTATIKEIRVNADFILVVEKDTVFKKLMDCDILQRLGQRCILMTVSRSHDADFHTK